MIDSDDAEACAHVIRWGCNREVVRCAGICTVTTVKLPVTDPGINRIQEGNKYESVQSNHNRLIPSMEMETAELRCNTSLVSSIHSNLCRPASKITWTKEKKRKVTNTHIIYMNQLAMVHFEEEEEEMEEPVQVAAAKKRHVHHRQWWWCSDSL